jgi:hypothetical protein
MKELWGDISNAYCDLNLMIIGRNFLLITCSILGTELIFWEFNGMRQMIERLKFWSTETHNTVQTLYQMLRLIILVGL